jgi:DNA modification methylase
VKLETIKIASLTPDPQNARTHDDTNLKAIQGSLKEFGQRKPIVITQDNTIAAGNGTVAAAKELGWTDIQAVRVPADWDADRIKAFALADNRTAELATWDTEVLNTQLKELESAGIDVSEFGFQELEVPILDIETFEDEIPDVPKIPTAKLGDIWLLGNHRVVCGDSTNPDVLSLALDGELADCIFTDPPYNVAYQGGTKDKLTIQNDDMDDAQFDQFLFGFYQAAIENTKEGGPIYVCYPGEHISKGAFGVQMANAGWLVKQVLIWAKDSLVLSRQDYNWQHEAILYGWKPGAAHSWYGPFTNTTVIQAEKRDWAKASKQELVEFVTAAFETSSVIREKRPRKNDIHPTMKPIALVSKLLKNSMLKGERVLDPFGGSGSTLIAAEQLGLKAAVVELDPKYVDAIITALGKPNRTEGRATQMTAGRPSKPIEQKRLLGNPGKRAMPSNTLALPMATETPVPSRPLLKYGQQLWDKVWDAGVNWISPNTDIELLLMTCEMVDERWNLRIKVMQTDDTTMRKGLRDLDRQLVTNLSLMGFTPSDRSRLGVAEVKAQSKLEELMERKATRVAPTMADPSTTS